MSQEKELDPWTPGEIAGATAKRWEEQAMMAAQAKGPAQVDSTEWSALQSVGRAFVSLDEAQDWLGAAVVVAPRAALSRLQRKSVAAEERFDAELAALGTGGDGLGERLARCGPEKLGDSEWGARPGGEVGELMLRASVAARRWARVYAGRPDSNVLAAQGALRSLAALIGGMEGCPGLALAVDSLGGEARATSSAALDPKRFAPSRPAAMESLDEAGSLGDLWRKAAFGPAALEANRQAKSWDEAEEIARSLFEASAAPSASPSRPRL